MKTAKKSAPRGSAPTPAPGRGGAKKTAHKKSAAEAPAPKKAAPKKAAPKKAAPKKGGRGSSTPPPEGVPFTRLQIKLMVMDELMEKGVIPPFSLKKVERECGKKLYVGANWVIPEDDFWGMQPEVRDWFMRYPLDPGRLASIESLSWSAGAGTMNHVAPNWDGEDALFDLTAADAADLHLLPSLKKVKASFELKDRQSVVDAFAARGVTLAHCWD